jgi:hypothetical protein
MLISSCSETLRSPKEKGGAQMRLVTLSAIGLITFAVSAGSALAASQSGEQKNVRRVAHTDLQGRAAYHPWFIVYPDGRVMAFIGTHSGNSGADGPKPNPLKPGSPVQPNGTMIVDITDPQKPVEIYHIPGNAAGAQSQSNRACLGSDLPGGIPGKVYLMRNVQANNQALSGYEVWDVSFNTAGFEPSLVGQVRNLRNTHKHWWECKTGIAYMPGSKGPNFQSPPAPQWRVGQQMLIFDWSNPTSPQYIRTFGLVGAQPGGTGPLPPTLHGPISAFEHPQAGQRLARGATADDVIGNRIYLAWGVGDDGALQVLDRKKLLPPPHGTWVKTATNADSPSVADLLDPQTARLDMSNDQGGHTSFPVFGMKPKSYENFRDFKTRDIVLLASESTADRCQEAPHWSFIVDVTIENSKANSAGPPALNAQQNPWQGPMVLSTMWVDPRAGEKYPRGNYCLRGARYGVHSGEENFTNPYYSRLTFLAYFTGGVRVWDIREPQGPVEVGYYVPVSNEFTEADGYMTNNLEVDNRGYVLAVDRNGAGFDLLELHGPAKQIGLGTE